MNPKVTPPGTRRQARRSRRRAGPILLLGLGFALLGLGLPPGADGGEAADGTGTLRSGGYTVVYPAGREKTAAYILEEAAKVSSRLREDLGGEPAGGAAIFLLDKPQGGNPPAPAGLPRWFAGAAYPRERTIYLKTSSALEGPADLGRALAHEMAHLWLKDRVGGKHLPRWLEEGVAMREAGEYDFSHRLSLILASLTGRLIPLGSIEVSFPDGEGPARLAYAESTSFVGRLMGEGGGTALNSLLDRVGEGKSFAESFRETYRRSVAEAEAAWKDSLSGRSRWISVAAGGSTFWILVTLLFLAVYWRKRAMARRKLEAMEEEERDYPAIH